MGTSHSSKAIQMLQHSFFLHLYGERKQYKTNMSKILTCVAVNLDGKLFMIGEHSTGPTIIKLSAK